MAEAAAIARAYEARKKELAEEAARQAGQQPWYDVVLQMFGLKPAAPDPGERIDEAALRALIASQVAAPREPAKEEAESPLVQSFAAALMRHKVTAPDSPAARGGGGGDP